MECIRNFQAFLENISLKSTREDRIGQCWSALKEFARNDRTNDEDTPGIGDKLREIFVQGSYAMGTSIRPVDAKDEFDVDTVLVLTLKKDKGSLPDSTETLRWVAERLRTNANYAKSLEVKKRCVRINYAGEFHLDVVPSESEGAPVGSLLIPDKGGRWIPTDPKGLIAWVADKEKESGQRFQRMVKYLKWWSRDVAPQSAHVASTVLTVMLGNHVSVGSSDAEALVETMGSLNDWLSLCQAKPDIQHPTVSINVAERWKESEFQSFKTALEEATNTAQDALNAPDKDESVELWQKVFGDQFPRLDDGGDDKGGFVPPRGPARKQDREFGRW